MGFFAVYPFIGFAEWADSLLNAFDKVKGHPLLVMTGMSADRAAFTQPCHDPVSC
jgi:hypothetical protein